MASYLLKGGLIVTGKRTEPYIGSLLIKDGKIAKIVKDRVDGENIVASNIIDVKGKIISPGFIDIHSHSDSMPLAAEDTQSKLFQGVTTEIVGNCGSSVLGESVNAENIGEFLFEQRSCTRPINQGILIGHGTLRGKVVGYDDRQASQEELEEMCKFLDNALKKGAFGLSLGLIYPPGAFSRIEELITLARVVESNNGILSVHLRSESDEVFEAVSEMIRVAEESGVKLNISHLKLIGYKMWHRSKELLDIINTARENGIKVTCDQYPYTATSTSLSSMVPKWAHDGGQDKMIKRLENEHSKIAKYISDSMQAIGGPASVRIANTGGILVDIEGKTIEEISSFMDLSPVETIIKILIECNAEVAAIYHSLNVDDVLTIMKDMNIAVGSDGSSYSYDKSITRTNPHPRNFGTFPRFFQMVRENQLMPIQDAVYKATKLPADILDFKDRGELKVGNMADIIVFDLEKIKDNSTFLDSVEKPDGIEHVFVAGVPLILHSKETRSYDAGNFLLKENK